jgi:hypothetical protein
MGASQSATSSYTAAATDAAADTGRPRPYGLTKTSRQLQLTSSYCDFYTGIVSLIQNNKYADLVIICGNDRYPVHRAIVCPRSRFFEEECAVRDGEVDLVSRSNGLGVGAVKLTGGGCRQVQVDQRRYG